MSLADKVTEGKYYFLSLTVKIILSESLPLAFSVPSPDKTQYIVHLSFNSNFQLINVILSDLQKSLKYVNGTAIVVVFF